MPTPATTIQSTTQQFLEIYDITNDMAVMKDGATALILSVDAMNFGLLAEEEQDAVMYAYAGLLNSLNYPIQIVIRSQTKDATNYLNLLKERENSIPSESKRKFISQYREFVANLIKERNVLDKKFYIAIPASSLEMGLLPPSTVIPGVKKIDISTVERSVILDKAKNILEPKRDHLISQFGRIGLYARQLQTQEIIQLFYTSYNPEAAEGQQITDTRDYVTTVVDAQVASTNLVRPQTQVATMLAPTPAPVSTPTPIATPLPATDFTSSPATVLTAAPDQTLVNSTAIYEEPPAVTEIPVSPELNTLYPTPKLETPDEGSEPLATPIADAPTQVYPAVLPATGSQTNPTEISAPPTPTMTPAPMPPTPTVPAAYTPDAALPTSAIPSPLPELAAPVLTDTAADPTITLPPIAEIQ